MKTFKEYCLNESKKDNTNKINCFMDLVEGIRDVFKDYTLSTRKKAWKKLNSAKAKVLFEQLLVNPNKSLNSFKSLDD
jgi:hypothetical protein